MRKKIFSFFIVLLFIIPALSVAQEKMYSFEMGTIALDSGNTVEFSISQKNGSLVLFNTKAWNGTRPDRCVLTVSLYDKNKNLIEKSSSLPITQDFPSFGSIAFKGVNKQNVSDVAYFTVKIEQ